MNIKRFGVSLEEDLLEALDNYAGKHNFPNRSQVIRHLIRKNLVEEKWQANQVVAGAIVLVYDHHKRDLQHNSTHIQHDFHDLILSVQHVHLDHHHCLETIAVKGPANDLQELASQLIGLKGIFHGKLVMSAI
ncbi:MAG: nickel-responsive transcriptional regulator NikR [Bacteroidales bacterium]|jgi:CopG family transcriptional regulator, nickel-responsive regulator